MWTCPKCETNNRDGDMNCFVCACDYKTYLEYRTVKQKEAAEAAAKVRAEEAAARARTAAEAAKKDQHRSTAAKKPAYTPPKTEPKPAAVKKPSESPKSYTAPPSRRTYTSYRTKRSFSEKHPGLMKAIKVYVIFNICLFAIILLCEFIDRNNKPKKSALYPAAYVCEQLEYAPDGEYFSLCLSPADTSYMISEEDSYVDLSEM